MKCGKCSNELKEGAKFCPKCGQKVEVAFQPSKGFFCPKCGRKLANGAQFCSGCGAQLKKANNAANTAAVPVYVPPVKKAKKVSSGIIALIIALCIALVSCGVVIYTMYINQDAEETSIDRDSRDNDKDNDKKKQEDETQEQEGVTNKPKVSSYSVVKADVTWEEASSSASSQGGYLVSINSKEEFDKVCEMAENMDISVFWIGAKRAVSENWGEVKWQDGEEVTFANWFDGEPTYISEEGNDEQYLMVFKVNDVWYFNDAENDVSGYYSGRMGYIAETEEQ